MEVFNIFIYSWYICFIVFYITYLKYVIFYKNIRTNIAEKVLKKIENVAKV